MAGQSDPEDDTSADERPASAERDPAAPPESGVDWRVFVGVGIAIAGFLVALLMAVLG